MRLKRSSGAVSEYSAAAREGDRTARLYYSFERKGVILMSQQHVRSQSLSSAAPLPRAWLDTIAPGTRVFFGVLFIVWSWASTIIIVGWILEPLLGNRSALGVVADRYVAGLVLSFLVSIAEFVSAERWPIAYW